MENRETHKAPTPTAQRCHISFVLPVYNEVGNLEEVCRGIKQVMDGLSHAYEIILVDDGSTDESFRVMEQLVRASPRVRAIRFRTNFGKSAAYNAGFRHARGDIILTMDADGQDDPQDIPKFLEKSAEGYDLVVGWKHQGKGTPTRRVASKIFNKTVSLMTGIHLHDFNCPFKAFRKEVLEEIEVYGDLHRYIPALASARGFTLTEIRVANRPRMSGVSKYGLTRYQRGVLDLLTVLFLTRFARRPLHLLGLVGLMVSGFGAAVLSVFIGAHFLFVLGVLSDPSWNIHDRPALGLGILLVVVGIQFLSIGLLGELILKSSAGRGPDIPYSIRQTVEHNGPEDSSGA